LRGQSLSDRNAISTVRDCSIRSIHPLIKRHAHLPGADNSVCAGQHASIDQPIRSANANHITVDAEIGSGPFHAGAICHGSCTFASLSEESQEWDYARHIGFEPPLDRILAIARTPRVLAMQVAAAVRSTRRPVTQTEFDESPATKERAGISPLRSSCYWPSPSFASRDPRPSAALPDLSFLAMWPFPPFSPTVKEFQSREECQHLQNVRNSESICG
jgi:hypothetical protein